MQLSPLAERVPPSGIREIVNLVLARPEGSVLRLEIGEPDFNTHEHIVAAACAAAAGPVRYTQSAGTVPLRQAISSRLARLGGLDIPVDQITVSQGGVEGCAAVMQALVSPGDEVMVPDPAWPNYEMQAILRGATPVRYPLRPEAGFVPDPAEVAALMTERTRLVVLNSPSNPTGAVIPRDVISAIVEAAAARGIPVLSDEVYDEFVFEGEAANAPAMDAEHVIGLYSFSKTYAMTGWRVGYVTANRSIAQLLSTIQEPLVSCISSVSQAAAQAALDGPQDCVALMRDAYRARRDVVVERFRAQGISVIQPHGAFYLMLGLADGVDSRRAALDLVEHGVSVAPGTAFGDVARSHVRISLASAENVLREATDRIVAWAERTDLGAALARSA